MFFSLSIFLINNVPTYFLHRDFSAQFIFQILINYFVYKSAFLWQFLITYIFSVSLKFRACYITGQWGEFRVKNSTLCLYLRFWHFFLFLSKNLFLSFSFLFLIKYQICAIEYKPIRSRNW